MSDKDVRNEIVEFIRMHPKTNRKALFKQSKICTDDSKISSQLLQLLGDGRVEYTADRKLVVVNQEG